MPSDILATVIPARMVSLQKADTPTYDYVSLPHKQIDMVTVLHIAAKHIRVHTWGNRIQLHMSFDAQNDDQCKVASTSAELLQSLWCSHENVSVYLRLVCVE